MITTRPYQTGDLALLPCHEENPCEGWEAHTEAEACGLTSYYLGEQIVAVSGYQLLWRGVAYAFAVIDRGAVKGHGLSLARAVAASIDRLMHSDSLHRVQSTCAASDRHSAAFLRATGHTFESTMRKASPDGQDIVMYAITKE